MSSQSATTRASAIIDCELLLAAKAAGATPYLGCDDCSGPGLKIVNGKVLHYEGHGEFGYEWAPRTDDGDALRLAADLDLFGGPSYWHYLAIARLEGNTDKHSNVRLAIFRAAVEIGKAMP